MKRMITIATIVFFLFSVTLPSYPQQETEIDELLNQGKQAYVNGNFKDAIKYLSHAIKIIKNREDLLDAYVTLSLTYFTLGEEKNGEESIKKALKIMPALILDADTYSPKFINFIERVKKDYLITVRFRLIPTADLYINQIYYENIEEASVTLVKGTYNIKVEKEGFKPFNRVILFDKSEEVKEIKLEKLPQEIPPETGKIEKKGKIKKKKKKIPTLLIVGAVFAVGILVYLLIIKKKPKYTLTVTKGEGVSGGPDSGTYSHKKEQVVNYSYTLETGYSSLFVRLDGVEVAASGTVNMDRNHTLVVSSTELGSIRVTSTPNGADIWLDDVDTGLKTNTVLDSIIPGSYTVKLVKDGYNDYEETVTVEAGQQTEISAVLEESFLGIEWVHIPAGEFEMGMDVGPADQKPQHTVNMSEYYISKFEITFEQYDLFCDETGRARPDDRAWGRGKRPVVNVSWYDAKEFCKWLSTKMDSNIHLPTEAQWEKAARGTDLRSYPWGNNLPSCSILNYSGCEGKTVPVGSYPPGVSPYGIHDMSGNVFEWCQDWYKADYYQESEENNPQGPNGGTVKVVRGGSCFTKTENVTTYKRESYPPTTTHAAIGFRICREAN